MPTLSRLMKAISLFSGAGGLDLGCEAAGFGSHAVIEWNERARETMLANADVFFPHLTADGVFSDITSVSGEQVLERVGLERGEVDLLSWWSTRVRRSRRAGIGLSTSGLVQIRRLRC